MRAIDMSHSLENEWLCLRLLDALGLQAAATGIMTFGEQKALCVERFDRAWMDSGAWGGQTSPGGLLSGDRHAT